MLSSRPNLALLYPLCNCCQSSPCTLQSCGGAHGGGKRQEGERGAPAFGLWMSEGWFTEVSMKLLELFFGLREDNWSPSMSCVSAIGCHIFSIGVQSSRQGRSYWWEIWRMHPWPIWVLITRPSGLRSLHRELKSKPCVNLRCTLTPSSPGADPRASVELTIQKVLRPVSSMQISLPVPNYLLVI